MREIFNKALARNIYIGGSVFFILFFLALTFDTTRRMPKSDNRGAISEEVALGKRVWEENNCIGCHTLLGEGAYFAPELGNVYERFGQSKEALKMFIKGRPIEGIPNRRSMPQFNLNDQELDAVAEFLIYTNGIDTQNWPPNREG